MRQGLMEPGGASFRREGAVGLVPVPIARSDMTIDEVLLQFLAEQRERLSARTYRRYEEVDQGLLQDCLDGYAYQSLDEEERRRWEEEFEDRRTVPSAACSAEVAENLGEFLDYFMVRKVIAGQELLKACRHGHGQVSGLAR